MEFLQIPLYDDDLIKLLVRFLFNSFFASLLVFYVYYPNQRRRNYVFTMLMMNMMVFFICFTLKKLELGLGMALGLFAVFAILRYRTDAIRIKEMTYLFIAVGLAVMNALSNRKTSYSELLFANSVIVATTWWLERIPERRKLFEKSLIYDNLELLKPDRKDDLLADLKERTGVDIVRIEVKRIDFRNNSATILAYYHKT